MLLLRLLNLLRSKQDTAILGEQVKRELIYRVLQAGGGDFIQNLSAIMSRSGVIIRFVKLFKEIIIVT